MASPRLTPPFNLVGRKKSRVMASRRRGRHLPWRVYPGGQLNWLTGTPGTPVESLLVTPSRQLWAKAASGVFVHEDGIWRPLTVPIKPIVGVLAWYSDSLWLAGTWGIRVYEREDWQPVAGAAFDAVLCLTVDQANTLWVGTAHHGLWRTPDGRLWEQVPLPSGHTAVAAITAAPDGSLWVAEGGFGRIPPERRIHRWRHGRWETLPLPNGPRPFRHVTSLAAIGAATLWVGTYEHGVYQWGDDSWSHFKAAGAGAKSGLPANTIMALCADKQGRVWAATHNGLGIYEAGYWSMGLIQSPAMPATDKPEPWPVMGARCLHLDLESRLWVGAFYPEVAWIETDQPRIDTDHA